MSSSTRPITSRDITEESYFYSHVRTQGSPGEYAQHPRKAFDKPAVQRGSPSELGQDPLFKTPSSWDSETPTVRHKFPSEWLCPVYPSCHETDSYQHSVWHSHHCRAPVVGLSCWWRKNLSNSLLSHHPFSSRSQSIISPPSNWNGSISIFHFEEHHLHTCGTIGGPSYPCRSWWSALRL